MGAATTSDSGKPGASAAPPEEKPSKTPRRGRFGTNVLSNLANFGVNIMTNWLCGSFLTTLRISSDINDLCR